MKSLLIALTALLPLSALAGELPIAAQPEVYSYGQAITCRNDRLEIKMVPRAPKAGEAASTFKDSGETLIKGKVDVTITERGVVLASFVAEDNTDPHESSWPVFNSDQPDFVFYAQDLEYPQTIEFKGQLLADNISCN